MEIIPSACRPILKSKKRIVGAAVIFTLISQIVYTLGAMLDMGFYTNPDYFAVWSKIMMPAAGAPPMEFFLYSTIATFIGALLFVGVYSFVGCCLKGSPAKRGLKYGFLIFLVATIPGSLSMFLLINLPALLIASWAVQGLITYLLGGAAVGKIVK